MVGIIDYGVGNLCSLRSSLEAIGPGVGAFEDAVKKLRGTGMDQMVYETVREGKPLLGICLGMQMLFEKSYEYGEHQGLGLLKGKVIPMEGLLPQNLKIPHMGWNGLHITQPQGKLFANTKEGDYVYFVHSYFADRCEDSLAAQTEYGKLLTAAVEKDNVFGCQFHPERAAK